MDMVQHGLPYIPCVMSAVDAGHVHACFEKIADQFIVRSRFRRHSHHNIRIGCIGVTAKNQIGIMSQQAAAVKKPFWCRVGD